MRHNLSRQDTLGKKGARKYQRGGDILIQVFTPKNAGRSESDAIVEALRPLFEGETFSGVTVNGFTPRESGVVDGQYLVVITATFTYYQTR